MLKKLTTFVASLFFGASVAFATVTVPNYNGQQYPANYFQNDSLLGCTPFQVNSTTTSAIIVASGSGFVSRLCSFNNTTTAAGYAVAVDSAPSTANCNNNSCNLGTNSLSNGTAVPGNSILMPVFSIPLGGTATTANNSGCVTIGDTPARFNLGLVVTNSSGTMQTVGCYRLDTGTNP